MGKQVKVLNFNASSCKNNPESQSYIDKLLQQYLDDGWCIVAAGGQDNSESFVIIQKG